jgi:D-beta-D-heptose 7-phosphate kinase/D-beta-D-heptose 1-phosphate adenosyltransferase
MIKLKRFEEICSKFNKKRILIFGDIILDRYIFGQVSRISPEAPVPVVKITKEEYRPGGAGNVAANIDKLGAQGILMGVCGDDGYFRELVKLKESNNFVINSGINKTLLKTRVISQRQQIVRIDREERFNIVPKIEEEFINQLKKLDIDAIIVSDYAKGTLTKVLMEALKNRAKISNIPIIVDPKPPNFDLYYNVDGITPNLKEAEKITNKKIEDTNDSFKTARIIQRKFKTKFSLITRGDMGITAAEKGKKAFNISAFSQEVFDVTGAGDTVVSVLTLSLVAGASLREAVSLANAAASIVIEKIGASQVTIEEIRNRIKLHLKR